MDDLISRVAAIDALTDENIEMNFDSVYDGEIHRTKRAAIRIVANLPTVDAVPVVRCRDCKHFIDMSGTSYPSYCYKHSTFDADGEFDNAFSVGPNKYCAWGERRESE